MAIANREVAIISSESLLESQDNNIKIYFGESSPSEKRSRASGVKLDTVSNEVANLVKLGDSAGIFEDNKSNQKFGFVSDGFGIEDTNPTTTGPRYRNSMNFGRGALASNTVNNIKLGLLSTSPDSNVCEILRVINDGLVTAKAALKRKGNVEAFGGLQNTTKTERDAFETINKSALADNAFSNPEQNDGDIWMSNNVSTAVYTICTDDKTGKQKVKFIRTGHAGVYAVGVDKNGQLHIRELTQNQDNPPLGSKVNVQFTEEEIEIDKIFADKSEIQLEYITASTIKLPATIKPYKKNRAPINPLKHTPEPVDEVIKYHLATEFDELTVVGHKIDKKPSISEWLAAKTISRRAFLVTAGLGLGGITLEGKFRIFSNLFGRASRLFKSLMPELGAEKNKPEITKLFEDVPNRELINEFAGQFLQKPPGGYNLPLEKKDDLQELAVVANACVESNMNGTDERSLHEMALMAVLESTINDNIKAKIDKEYPGLNLEARINTLLNTSDPSAWKLKANSPVTVGDLMFAMQACGSMKAREWGLKLIYKIIESGKLEPIGLKKLSEDKINWGMEFLPQTETQPGYYRNIAPESLVWAEYTRDFAIELLREGADLFFDALTPEEREKRIKNLESTVCNPGIIASLNREETGNMINVGSVPAEPQLNTANKQYPTGPNDLKIIGGILKDLTQIPYDVEFENSVGAKRKGYQYIHASPRLHFDSGGAVFGQFMPIHMVHFLEKLIIVTDRLKAKGREYPPILPGSPFWMPIFQYLYLNGQWRFLQGYEDGSKVLSTRQEYKGGYIAGADMQDTRENAIRTWNNYDEEIERVLIDGNGYWNRFLAEPVSESPKKTKGWRGLRRKK